MRPQASLPARQRGLSLIDLIIVVVIVSILASYAIWKINQAGDDTLWYQAQRLARDIRHVQVLSSTWGRQLQITPTAGVNGSYSVSCVVSGGSPCNGTSTLVDPTTGSAFTVSLSKGVSLAVSGTSPTKFDNQGRPLNSAGSINNATTTYTVSFNGSSVAIAIAPVTGYVSTTP